jgi:hypothetical protein
MLWMANEHIKICYTTIIIRKMHTKTTVREVISALRKQRQEEIDIEAILGYKDSVSKQTNKKKPQ